MNEKEIDELFTYVLNRIRDLNRNFSEELTKKFKEPQYRALSKQQRKFAKVELLIERDYALFRQAIAPLNIEWLNEPRSPVNFFEILEKKSTALNIFGELTGGNYSGKV